ncbi:hypothetical protein [Saccharopolyspora sp. CA-218241]|uniref:hypothetical protein n=1 Tax=Saccharopolyspora sp. CA-218241 TaxID=3240027 RepID=UPI003D999C25
MTESWPVDGTEQGTQERSGVHQPWRTAIAAVELLIALGLAVTAWWAWGRGIVPIYLPGPGGATDVVTRSVGSWLATAIAAGGVGALLVLDAIRQLVLAIRVRDRG